MFKAGDEIIAMDDLYGGTYRLFTRLYKDSGIKFHFVDMNDFEKFDKHLKAEAGFHKTVEFIKKGWANRYHPNTFYQVEVMEVTNTMYGSELYHFPELYAEFFTEDALAHA